MLHETVRQALIDASKIEPHKKYGQSVTRLKVIDGIVDRAMLSTPEVFNGLALRDRFPERFNKQGLPFVKTALTDEAVNDMVNNIWESL
jgi:hypothetical protein